MAVCVQQVGDWAGHRTSAVEEARMTGVASIIKEAIRLIWTRLKIGGAVTDTK